MIELLNRIAALAELKKSGRGCIFFVILFSWILLFMVLFNPNLLASQQDEPKNILVLFSFRPTLPVASKWDWGIQSIFKAEPNLKADINIEYLDLSRFNDPHYIKMIFSVFRHKYFESKPDLIIAVYEPALDFLLRHREELFPGVPIVFGGVERVFIENRVNMPDITGVYQGSSFIKTLETALNLHPNTRHIRIFVGAGMLEQSWATAAREAYVRFEDKYDFVYVPVQSIEDLQKKMAELAPNTLILYLPILKDGLGKTHVAKEVLSRISEVSTAPIYGFWEGVLGVGIVGGHLSSFEEQAKTAAKIGMRILKGARAADIPPIDTPGLRYMFDWQQLRRWSISEDRLPPGSTVMFKESSAWEKYKGLIIGAVALIVFQMLVILLLLHQHRLRRKTEYQLKDRLQFERKLSELSSEFINLPSEKIDPKITDALAWIGPFMQADRSHMFRFNWDRSKFRITHVWEAEGVKKDEIALPGLIVKDAFPWLFENLIAGRDVIVSDIEMLPAKEAGNEYRYCREIGILSFIILPIEIENASLCAIGMDAIHEKRQWPQEVQDRLRILGEIIANTIVRHHAEKKSEVATLRYRTIADFTYDWEYWQNADGKLEYVSPSCERICGYSVQELVAKPSLLEDMIVPEDKEMWDVHRCNIQKQMKPEEIQFRIQRADGEIRWIEHACQPVFDHLGNNQGVRASNRDITQRELYKSEAQKLQSELAHMDRVVTISALTSALAHEINQPLAAMRSYAQAGLRFLDAGVPDHVNVRKALEGIVADNKRASAVVNRLRDLVKKKQVQKEILSTNQIIEEVIRLINSELVMRDTTIETDLDPSSPTFYGDSIQIQQVLMNLLTNALDAMDDLPVGKRTMKIHSRVDAANKIRVSIVDHGKGIAPEQLEDIFLPFRTTKAKGLGLGLAISKSIINAHGGNISAKNNPHGGATFVVTLPAVGMLSDQQMESGGTNATI